MVPLKYRKNQLISIEIKSILLEYSRYKLQVLNKNGESTSTQLTEKTYVNIIYIYI